MRTLGVLLAMVVGFVVWAIILGLTLTSNPLGTVGPVEQLMVWAPIIGTAVPIALYRLNKGAVVSGAWVLALAPFLSTINIAWYMAFIYVPGAPNAGKMPLGLIVISMAWQLPWLYVLVQWLKNFRRALEEEKSAEQ